MADDTCRLDKRLILRDRCAGSCSDDEFACRPIAFRRYGPFGVFGKQAKICDCVPKRYPHSPTPAEQAWLRENFPDLPLGNTTVTGGMTRAYNCIGYSLCARTFGWTWMPQALQSASAAKQVEWFDDLYKSYGWKLAADCKPEKGKRKIALYCGSDTKPTHAAKQIVDDIWESKLGQGYRIRHHGNSAVEGKAYGTVCRCYEKSLNAIRADAATLLGQVRQHIAAGENGSLITAESELQQQIKDLDSAIAREGST